MKFKNGFFLLAALTLTVSCSTTSYTPTSREMNDALMEITGQDGRSCVRVSDISGFGPLDDSTVSVSDKFRAHYLMVTSFRCTELGTSFHAAFKGAFTEFCGRRDSLYAGGQRCPVQSVFEFENRDAAFAAYDKAEEMIRAEREAEKGQE